METHVNVIFSAFPVSDVQLYIFLFLTKKCYIRWDHLFSLFRSTVVVIDSFFLSLVFLFVVGTTKVFCCNKKFISSHLAPIAVKLQHFKTLKDWKTENLIQLIRTIHFTWIDFHFSVWKWNWNRHWSKAFEHTSIKTW